MFVSGPQGGNFDLNPRAKKKHKPDNIEDRLKDARSDRNLKIWRLQNQDLNDKLERVDMNKCELSKCWGTIKSGIENFYKDFQKIIFRKN